jgi:hypothetical protein
MQRRAVKLAIASVFVCSGLAACERPESRPTPMGATTPSTAPQVQYQQPGNPSVQGVPALPPQGMRGSRSGP